MGIGDAATPATTPGRDQGQPDGGQSQGTSTDWRVALPDDLRADKALESFKTPEDAYRALINAQRHISETRKIVPPKEGDAPEAWDQYYNALGRPETPEGYEFSPPGEDYPKGLYNESLDATWRQQAHKLGLSAKQAQEARQWLLDEQRAQYQTAHQEFVAQRDEAMAKLKLEWGGDYDRNLHMAQRLIQTFAEPESVQFLNEGMGNDVRMVRLAAKIASALDESKLVALPDDSSGKSLDDRIKDLMADKAFMNATDPNHGKIVAELESLYKRKFPAT